MIRYATQPPVPNNHALEILTLVFAAFGIMEPPGTFVAGLLLATAGSLMAVRWKSKDDSAGRPSFWIIILTGITIASVGIMFLQAAWAKPYIAGIPVPALMFALGFSSSYIVRIALRFLRKIETRAGDIANKKLGLPPEEDK